MRGYIYCYTNKQTNKRYIGQTVRNPKCRAGASGYRYKKCNAFWNAIQKYGWDSFTLEILETLDCDSQEQLLEELAERERYWISYYHTWVRDPECQGYNLLSSSTYNCSGYSPWNKGLTKEQDERLGRPNAGQWKKGHLNSPEAMQRAWAASTGERSKVAKKVRCIETGEVFISGVLYL